MAPSRRLCLVVAAATFAAAASTKFEAVRGGLALAGVRSAIDALAAAYAPALDVRRAAAELIVGSNRSRAILKGHLARAVSRNRFVAAFGGHSVCAGHGNYFNESYAAVADAALRSGMASAKIDARADNLGMGGTGSVPFAWCAETMAGDVDVVGWDYNMVDGKKWRGAEVFARAAWSLPSRPALLFFLDSARDPRRAMLEDYERADAGLAVFAAPAPSDFLKKLPQLRKWSARADAPHAVRDVAYDPPRGSGEALKRRKFNTPDGAPGRVPWHPGWRVNKLVGTLVAVWLLTALEDALVDRVAAPRAAAPPPLPPPSQPRCNDQTLLCDRALYACATTYAPKAGLDLGDVAAGWRRILAAGDPSLAAERLGLGYRDRKWTLVGARGDGPLELSLPAAELRDGELVLCSATTGWRKPANFGDLRADAALTVYDKPDGRELALGALRSVDHCFRTRVPTKAALGDADRLKLALRVTTDNEVYLSHVIWG